MTIYIKNKSICYKCKLWSLLRSRSAHGSPVFALPFKYGGFPIPL